MKGVVSGYDIVYETPARRWEDGLPIGNGSIGCLACAPTHPEWVVNKNDVYDYRTAPFKRLKHREVVALGPARKWLWVYQKAQNAGKGLQLYCEDIDDALALTEGLRPEGTLFCIGGGPYKLEEAEAFVKRLERWSVGKK